MSLIPKPFPIERCLAAAMCLSLSIVTLLGCSRAADGEPGQVTTPPPAEEAAEPPLEDATAPADEPTPDPYAVPNGTPAELAEFIQSLMLRHPTDRETFEKVRASALAAADKIMAGKPDDARMELAVRVKVHFLTDPKAIEALIDQLKAAKLSELARLVGVRLLAQKVRDAMTAPDEPKRELVERVTEFLAEGPVGRTEAALAMMVGELTEVRGTPDLAVRAYTDFGKLLRASMDPDVVAYGKTMEGVVRRLTLVGKPIKVEGTVFGGEKLDWDAYQGKVVLVDFWATWCGPCLAEVPNLKRNYEQYRDRGFEIVALSLDQDGESLRQFIEREEIPWTIVYDEDNPSPTPDYYGVVGIPSMILVDADGKVVSTQARGPHLDKELKKLLGPPELSTE